MIDKIIKELYIEILGKKSIKHSRMTSIKLYEGDGYIISVNSLWKSMDFWIGSENGINKSVVDRMWFNFGRSGG